MTTIDAFSAADSTDSTTDDSLSDTTEYKYAQLVVPNFKFETTSTSTTSSNSTAGSSFLRLGSFPGLTSSDLSGFTNSVALAKLVGDVSSNSVYTGTTEDSTSTSGDGVFTSDPYKGDEDGILGFADDTRIRNDASETILHVNGSTTENSVANRKDETKKLLTKGGWWDHSDGNRISTTAGDKVEVIQGNYKLVVLGRRAASDTDDAQVVDISGGYQFTKTYEYLAKEKVWATFEESSTKHATSISSGKSVTYFTGDLRKLVIGEDPDGLEVFKPKSWLKGPSSGQDPEVISKTWAKKIESYTGSLNKPVPHIFSITYAHAKEDIQIGSSNVAVKTLVGDNTSVTVCGVNVSTTSCLLDITIKTMPVALSVSAVGQNFEAKFGYNLGLHSATTGVFWQKTEVKAAEVDVGALANQVYSSIVKLTNQQANLSNTVTELSTKQTRMAGSMSNLAVDMNHLANLVIFG